MGESACVGSSWLPGPPPPVYACTLSPELVAKAREELQEKPEWRLRDAQALRDMILKEQPDLQTRLDDAFLLRFLRARKFDYDRALRLLLNYHAGRTAWPEVFRGLRPSAVKHVLDAGFLTVLPRPDPDGRQMEGGTLPLRGQREGGVPHPGEAGAGGGHAGQRRRGLGRLQRRGRVAGLRPGAFPGQEGGGRPSGRLPGAHQGRPRGQRAPHFQRHLCADQALPEGEDGPAGESYTLHSSDLRSLHRQIPPSVLPEEYGGVATATADARSWSDLLMDSEEDLAAEFCRPPEEAPEDRRQFRGPRSQLYSCY
ncbi:alpha-tocopherol transfer protein-like isoform X3 [Stigmatopora argus]